MESPVPQSARRRDLVLCVRLTTERQRRASATRLGAGVNGDTGRCQRRGPGVNAVGRDLSPECRDLAMPRSSATESGFGVRLRWIFDQRHGQVGPAANPRIRAGVGTLVLLRKQPLRSPLLDRLLFAVETHVVPGPHSAEHPRCPARGQQLSSREVEQPGRARSA
jgi:hypothetical protein